MATITLYARGDQIATYESLTVKGKSNGTQVQVKGAETLGTEADVFRIVIRDVKPGETEFSSGQAIDIYAYPDTSNPPVPIYSSLDPHHDDYNGRASSNDHQIFSGTSKVILDVNGFAELPDFRYGPGLNPPRSDQMDFDSFAQTPPTVPCFAAGTLIETVNGPLPIECLKAGDMVLTQDGEAMPLRWIGSRTVSGLGEFAPILFQAGALGNFRDLMVSPQHRMLVDDWRAMLWFGQPHVLVAACHLVNDRTILRAPQAQVTYVHMLFDRHVIVFAEGIASESLHLGQTALASLPRQSRDEVLRLFPDLASVSTAHTCLRGWEGRLIA